MIAANPELTMVAKFPRSIVIAVVIVAVP